MNDAGGVAAVVLAAGRGARLGRDAAKPLVAFRGRPLVAYALDAAIASGLAPVVLVVGYRADDVLAVAPEGVAVVRNDEWAEGIASSLRAALAYLGEAEPEVRGAVIGLADQPLVGSGAWQRVAAAAADGTTLAVATYGGRRGNPVLLARPVWPDALQLRGDEGARQLLRANAVVEVPCDGTGRPDDVDTVADLETIEEEASRRARAR